jgi:hypothetical protein
MLTHARADRAALVPSRTSPSAFFRGEPNPDLERIFSRGTSSPPLTSEPNSPHLGAVSSHPSSSSYPNTTLYFKGKACCNLAISRMCCLIGRCSEDVEETKEAIGGPSFSLGWVGPDRMNIYDPRLFACLESVPILDKNRRPAHISSVWY